MFRCLIVVKSNDIRGLNLLGIGRGHLKVTTYNLAGAGGTRLSTLWVMRFSSSETYLRSLPDLLYPLSRRTEKLVSPILYRGVSE